MGPLQRVTLTVGCVVGEMHPSPLIYSGPRYHLSLVVFVIEYMSRLNIIDLNLKDDISSPNWQHDKDTLVRPEKVTAEGAIKVTFISIVCFVWGGGACCLGIVSSALPVGSLTF